MQEDLDGFHRKKCQIPYVLPRRVIAKVKIYQSLFFLRYHALQVCKKIPGL